MNFFGHAAVACWRSTEPGYVLGAMLPDLAAMIGARPPGVGDATMAKGVAFHHLTDDAFHDSPTFRALMGEALKQLVHTGIERGRARAVAHVGVEILLDGVLADSREARAAYLAALAHAPRLSAALEWRNAGEGVAYTALITSMRARGVSRQHTTPSVVAMRVEHALSARPRLAIDRAQLPLVEAWARAAASEIRQQTPRLLTELEGPLALPPTG
ncbi:MAG: hypothetical protein IT375_07090 [Polyangiaceae bacterium]|nr:hypothetical protein [Polyangiaceae bacterium]